MAPVLQRLARCAIEKFQPDCALTLLAAASVLREKLGISISAPDGEELDQTLGRARKAARDGPGSSVVRRPLDEHRSGGGISWVHVRLLSTGEERPIARLSPDAAWVLYVAFQRGSGLVPIYRLMRLSVTAECLGRCSRLRETGEIITAPAARKRLRNSRGRVTPDSLTFAIARRHEADIRIRLLSLCGGPDREITLRNWLNISSLDWSPDGKGLYCGVESPYGSALFYVDLKGVGRCGKRGT